ncbi:MAG: mechanosensitive ion channel protein MscS [Betaproteobacteria bacterium TMED156]|nr:MAG: mechanosensitive ion channel protein MscS [Betaproteobacteria bacterium TMED156]
MNFFNLADFSPWMQTFLGLFCMFGFAFLSQPISKRLIVRSFDHWRILLKTKAAQVLLDNRVGQRLSQLSPSLFIQITVSLIPYLSDSATVIIKNVAVAVTVLHTIRVLLAILDAFQTTYSNSISNSNESSGPVKSYIQLGKLLIIGLGSIVIISALIDRSPLILLSGLGAMSAVLLIVFKDTLVSFTAGLQLSSNDMLRVGDWIEMPELGADGDVVDIALHTVKVQNWDKTITSIPTWRLMSSSFKNWRGMADSGGRRIKRTLLIDSSSIKFLDDLEVEKLKNILLIKKYLKEKTDDLSLSNNQLSSVTEEINSNPINQRRLTNIGTFRAYVNFYIFNHKKIHKKMTRLVRMLKPDSEGIPLEIYCFTSTTDWVEYEDIQSDIFEHLLATLPEFDLRLYQKPSGNDFKFIKI